MLRYVNDNYKILVAYHYIRHSHNYTNHNFHACMYKWLIKINRFPQIVHQIFYVFFYKE